MKFGKCTPRKTLTKKLNMPGWELYRDSAYGMDARNDELGLDVNLMGGNVTLDDPNLENILEGVRAHLIKADAEKQTS